MNSSQVTWVLPDGRRITADVAPGSNLMLAAIFEGVPGIDGDCGGCLSCATCHVIVDAAWVTQVGAASDEENAMLDSTLAPRQLGDPRASEWLERAHTRLQATAANISNPALRQGFLEHIPAHHEIRAAWASWPGAPCTGQNAGCGRQSWRRDAVCRPTSGLPKVPP